MKDSTSDETRPLSFVQMMLSILASFFGVQSSKRRERDFKNGRAAQFIAVGVFMTVVWYSVIALVVKFALP